MKKRYLYQMRYGYRFFIPKYAREAASCQSIRNELPVAGHVGGRPYVCQHMQEKLITAYTKNGGARYIRDAEKIRDEIKFIKS